jgi:hypothetical protein
VIAFDIKLDHSCAEVWGVLEAPDGYPRYFRGLGSCEEVAGKGLHNELPHTTPRGAEKVHEMRQTLRQSN